MLLFPLSEDYFIRKVILIVLISVLSLSTVDWFYKNKFNKRNFPNTNYVYKNIISLPFHNNLKLKEVKYVTKVINNFFKYETKKK